MPRVNKDSHGKFSNFICEYLHVITRGLSHVCEFIFELYRTKHTSSKNIIHTSVLIKIPNIFTYLSS